MGMFDTFYGKIKCPICGEVHKFEEQTKSYDCVLDSFLLGDYIDKANQTYVYQFEAICDKNKQLFNGNIIVFKGQIVNFLNDEELSNVDIHNLSNIEEGLGHKLEYLERCEKGIGINNECWAFGTIFENEKINWNEHPKNIGDKLFALKNEEYSVTNNIVLIVFYVIFLCL